MNTGIFTVWETPYVVSVVTRSVGPRDKRTSMAKSHHLSVIQHSLCMYTFFRTLSLNFSGRLTLSRRSPPERLFHCKIDSGLPTLPWFVPFSITLLQGPSPRSFTFPGHRPLSNPTRTFRSPVLLPVSGRTFWVYRGPLLKPKMSFT